jgi:hypothetical protein
MMSHLQKDIGFFVQAGLSANPTQTQIMAALQQVKIDQY